MNESPNSLHSLMAVSLLLTRLCNLSPDLLICHIECPHRFPPSRSSESKTVRGFCRIRSRRSYYPQGMLVLAHSRTSSVSTNSHWCKRVLHHLEVP